MTFLELNNNKKLLIFGQNIDDTKNVLLVILLLTINSSFAQL